MADQTLFPVGEAPTKVALPAGIPRVQVPVRDRVELLPCDLDSLISFKHQARAVWAFVERADLSSLRESIRAFEGRAGRTPIDPRILLALWIFATLKAVGSARQLALLCEEHLAYRWLCGGVSVNYHTLADFRSESAALFERVLCDSIARLRATGLVSMKRVAHDGVRVRASAGTGSFRGKETLELFQKEAEEQVQALRQELLANPKLGSKRQRSARKRAARERLALVKKALEFYPAVEAKKKDKKRKARVSVSDPDARVMKMANGGFNPAFNVQLSADTDSQIIVGVSVSQAGADYALMVPAVQQIQAQSGCAPKEMLFDGGFAKPESVEALSQEPYGCVVYAPPTVHKDKAGNVIERKSAAGPGEEEWRKRMALEETKAIYQERASTIECVNALARNRGLQQFRVRGMQRVKAVVLLFALAQNLARAESLKKKVLSG